MPHVTTRRRDRATLHSRAHTIQRKSTRPAPWSPARLMPQKIALRPHSYRRLPPHSFARCLTQGTTHAFAPRARVSPRSSSVRASACATAARRSVTFARRALRC
eukprot:3946472-Pleurochrysis_carterae.AAC.1